MALLVSIAPFATHALQARPTQPSSKYAVFDTTSKTTTNNGNPNSRYARNNGMADRSLATETGPLFSTADFPTRSRSGTSSTRLGLLHIIPNIAIFIACVTIPFTLLVFIRKRRDVPFAGVFWLFGAFIIFCGLSHLMDALVFYWPAFRFAGPLKLGSAIACIATSILLVRAVPKALQLKSPTELQALIEQRTTELRASNQALLNANEELAAARVAAEQADKTKSAFLANMSHEIRTPMTAILGFTDLMSDQHQGNPETIRAIDTVRRNGKHLLHVVNDILDLSRFEAGELAVEVIPFSPHEMFEDICMLHDGVAAAKGLTLHCAIDKRVPEGITSDPARLKQVVTNLVANALKFTEEGGVQIRVATKKSRNVEYLRIDVIDTGIGMSASQQHRIFTPFVQADDSPTRRFGGTGLGLTISHRLAGLMGGSLKLIRSRIDEGTHFRVMIPYEPCSVESTPKKPATPTSDKPAKSPGRPKLLKGYRVLLVEDGIDNQRLFSAILRNAGADLKLVENGRDAMLAALDASKERQPFDVILMDMQMPVMDGYTATRNLRESGYEGQIVALTAHAMAGDRELCLEAGCDEYLSKPTERADLIDIVLRHAQIKPTPV